MRFPVFDTLPLVTFAFILIVSPFSSQAQSWEKADSTYNYIELSGTVNSNERTPFWMQSNQYGVIPKSGSFGTVRGGYNYSTPIHTHWRAGIGIEAVANLGDQTKILFPQINGSLSYKNIEMYIGRKKQNIGLADSTLGSGSYAWSNNALPIPRIQIGTIGFVPVPFTKEWISVKAFYSDGLFDKNRLVTSELKLHQKIFYARIGKKTSQLKLYAGFNHQVEWGGKSPYFTKDGQMPVGFKNYINVVMGKAHSKTATNFDSTGRVGNHLGSIDVGFEIETYSASIFVYRQNFYDDGSLIWLDNISDGLNGIRLRRKNDFGSNFSVKEVVFEYLYTKNQGGPTADYSIQIQRGKDDYFNNSQVRDGWSYLDRAIGTPFIPPTSDTRWKWPSYADYFTSNNRVSVVHLGMNGTLFQKINWMTKLSFSSNEGTYDVPFSPTPTQFSGILALWSKIDLLGGTLLRASVALDSGSLYPNTVGFSVGIRKNFSE